MGEFVITYRELVAWFLVVVFAAIAIIIFIVKPGCDCDETIEATAATDTTNTDVEEPLVVEKNEEPIENEDSCFDKIKNQDETDADCGGSCTECTVGKLCKENSDCSTDSCVSGKCAKKLDLSGDIDLVVKDVTTIGGGATSAKVDSIEASITNGKAKNANLELRIWAKSFNNVYYHNQIGMVEDRDDEKPYIIIPVGNIAPGKTITQTFDESGSYLFGDEYESDDDFSLEILLIDKDTDTVLQTVRKGVTI